MKTKYVPQKLINLLLMFSRISFKLRKIMFLTVHFVLIQLRAELFPSLKWYFY